MLGRRFQIVYVNKGEKKIPEQNFLWGSSVYSSVSQILNCLSYWIPFAILNIIVIYMLFIIEKVMSCTKIVSGSE